MGNYKLNDNKINEAMLELYKAIGKEGIQKIYHTMGGEKFTIIPLVNHIKRERILELLRTTSKSVKKIALEEHVDPRTVYRMLSFKKKNKDTSQSQICD